MGFFQGVAKAYGEISSEKREERLLKGQKEEREAEREENRRQQIEDRDLAIKARRAETLAALGLKRSSAGAKASEYALAPKALATYLGEYAETPEGKAWLQTAIASPDGAQMALDAITSSKRTLSPEEVVNGITIVGQPGSAGIIEMPNIEEIDVSDDEAYAEAMSSLLPPGTPKSQIVISGSVKDEYSPADVNLAKEEFKTATQNAARESLKGLPEAERQNHPTMTLLNNAAAGDEDAAYQINQKFSGHAAYELKDNPYFPAIGAIPGVRKGIQMNEGLKQMLKGDEISDEVRQTILTLHPYLAEED